MLKSEGFQTLNENFIFYDKKVFEYMCKNDTAKLRTSLIKNFVVKSIPFLKKIKRMHL
jgi:CRISPR/Cas system-associated protein Cas7 (RAMP superfamily)